MNYDMVQVNFQLCSFNFTQFVSHRLTCSELCCAHIKRHIFWKLRGLGISNTSFLIADVIQYVSGTMISFSKRVQQNSNLRSFQNLAPRLYVTWNFPETLKTLESFQNFEFRARVPSYHCKSIITIIIIIIIIVPSYNAKALFIKTITWNFSNYL